jgi:hypothetical protein
MSSQALNNTRFTAEAAEWDANLKHVESTRNAFDAIQRYVPAFKDGKQKGTSTIRSDCMVLDV